MTALPAKLKQAGYSTHMVGKWHEGFFGKGIYPSIEDLTHRQDSWLGLRITWMRWKCVQWTSGKTMDLIRAMEHNIMMPTCTMMIWLILYRNMIQANRFSSTSLCTIFMVPSRHPMNGWIYTLSHNRQRRERWRSGSIQQTDPPTMLQRSAGKTNQNCDSTFYSHSSFSIPHRAPIVSFQ